MTDQNTDRGGLPSAQEILRGAKGGFTDLMGLVITKVTQNTVEAELEVTDDHLQPFGLVHGGVHAAIVETLCSVGASQSLEPGQAPVGVENHTSFLKPVTGGMIRAIAEPIQIGKRTQLWETKLYNDKGQLVSTGRLRLMVIEIHKSS